MYALLEIGISLITGWHSSVNVHSKIDLQNTTSRFGMPFARVHEASDYTHSHHVVWATEGEM